MSQVTVSSFCLLNFGVESYGAIPPKKLSHYSAYFKFLKVSLEAAIALEVV